MGSRPSLRNAGLSLVAVVLAALLAGVSEALFHDQFDMVGPPEQVRVTEDGKATAVSLTMDRGSGGAGFNSRDMFLFGKFSVQMKLIAGNSAGTVTCLYLSSGDDDRRDEIDIEFMGNLTGDPYVMNTNVWVNGDGKKEHQFHLWFDPAADFHTYTIIWNPKNIIFQVDDVPVRTFRKYDGLPYPSTKPMAVHATLWDGSDWATCQGKVKIDWSQAPFVVSYRGYSVNACVRNSGGGPSSCAAGSAAWMGKELDAKALGTVAWAERTYMSYNYCADGWRFPQGFPAECYRH